MDRREFLQIAGVGVLTAPSVAVANALRKTADPTSRGYWQQQLHYHFVPLRVDVPVQWIGFTKATWSWSYPKSPVHMAGYLGSHRIFQMDVDGLFRMPIAVPFYCSSVMLWTAGLCEVEFTVYYKVPEGFVGQDYLVGFFSPLVPSP